MRKITTIVAALLLSVATFAQAPQGFSYQAVVRDAQNALVANQTVDVTLTLKAEIKGLPVQTYTEKHSAKTNANGLLTLVVGQGESSQKFSDFKWNLPEAIYNLETVTPYGTGTAQLLSVPYALYAEQAGEIDYVKLLSSLKASDLSTILGLADYLKQADIQELLSTYALKTEIPTTVNLSGYATKDTLNNFALKSSVANDYVTKETFENYVLSGGSTESVDLTVYAKTADVAATYATTAKLKDTLKVYAKTADVAATYATKAKLNDTLNVYSKIADLATVATTGSYNDLTDRPTIPAAPDLSAYAKKTDVPMINVTVKMYEYAQANHSAVGTTIKLFDMVFESKGTKPEPIEKVYKMPAYSVIFLNIKKDAGDGFLIKVNGEGYNSGWHDSDTENNGFGTGSDEFLNDRMYLLFKNGDRTNQKWIFALPGEDCTIEISINGPTS
ncbi:MAG: hypothetical protein IKW86_00185 [Salinivirgaceae bacterium]|nr:hypothetical protein [Salinivirgaceae bacterium]